jgi:hypothetical protein
MSENPIQAAIVKRGDSSLGLLAPSGRQYQALWFALARLAWNSLVLVPADTGGSTDIVTRALANIGDQLSITPVTSVLARPNHYKLAIQIAVGAAGSAWSDEERANPRAGRILIAIESVIDEPLGVGVCQGADATVICVDMGRSRLASVRRTVELIGRDKIVGTFVID